MPPNVWASLVKRLGRNGEFGSISTATAQSNLKQSQCRQQYGRNLRRAVYMACGVIFISTSLGFVTARQELLHAPNVLLNKKKRKQIPEVEDPHSVLRNSDDFVKKSLFRRLGKVRPKSVSSSADDHHNNNNNTDNHK